jgi:heme exporter protein C
MAELAPTSDGLLAEARTDLPAPARARAADPVSTGLALLAGLGMPAALWLTFAYAPTDRVQGEVQRIFYLHVSMAWVAFLAFFVVFVASVGYLWTRRPGWDVVGRSSADVGVLFTTLVLLTGSLWGKPVWGTWWTWDAKLTTTLILWLLYVAYLMVRAYAGDPERGARYAAVVGIVGFVDVPIVYKSVEWWRTLHPGPVVAVAGGPAMPPEMVQTLAVTLAAVTLLYGYLLRQKTLVERARDAVARARAEG